MIYGGGLLGIAVVFVLVRHNAAVGWMLALGSIAVLAYVGRHLAAHADRAERQRVMLALTLVSGSVVFWTLFEQAGSSLQIFADRNVDLRLIDSPVTVPLFGHELFFGSRDMLAAAAPSARRWWVDMSFASSQTQSFNPGFILLFAPVFAALWSRLGRRGRDPAPMTKFGLALIQVGLGFLLLVLSARFAGPGFRTPLVFLALSYLLQTTGELCLSPVGMSQVTKLSPAALVSTMMAVWFLSISWAEWIGGLIAQAAGTETIAGQVLDPAHALATSARVFGVIGLFATAVGVVFLLLSRPLTRWAGVADALSAPPASPEPVAPTLDGERQAVNPAVLRADRTS
jgi:proton-dependent oligopeptide transporter, POT family